MMKINFLFFKRINPLLEFRIPNLVISTKETRAVANRRSKSPQVTPQRKSNFCRASRGDFSSVEMTNLELIFHCRKNANVLAVKHHFIY